MIDKFIDNTRGDEIFAGFNFTQFNLTQQQVEADVTLMEQVTNV